MTVLDGLHEDLNNGRKVYREMPAYDKNSIFYSRMKLTNRYQTTDETLIEYSKKWIDVFTYRNKSPIYDLFYGVTVSVCTCSECQNVSANTFRLFACWLLIGKHFLIPRIFNLCLMCLQFELGICYI